MWGDEKFQALSRPEPNARDLFVFLLSHPDSTAIPGPIRAGERGMAEQLQWELEGFRKAFLEVSSKGMAKADWKARFVWVPNALRYNPPASPNVVTSWRIPWDELPECDLKREAYESLRGSLEGMGEAWVKAFVKACPKPSCKTMANQEQEQEQDPEQEEQAPETLPSPPTSGTPSLSFELGDPHPPPTKAQAFVDLWNATVTKLPKCIALTPERTKKIMGRVRTEPDLEQWRAVFQAADRSDFYTGNNQRQWRATIDHFIENDTNAAKVLERGTQKVFKPR